MDNYAWRGAAIWLALCITTLALLTSCGGGNGSPVNGNDAVSDAPAGGAVAGGPTQTITEDEVSSLPAWQQDLLADPGWNQPTIPQRADTPMPSPSYEMLLDWQAKAQQDGIISAARGSEGAKGASWIGDSPWVPTTAAINRGEYNIPFSAGGSVPYGCKDTTGTNNHMKEKKLAAEPIPVGANQAITYVLKGISNSNHFNTTGGASNNALCAVYQIWSSKRNADPTQPYSSYSPPSSAPLFAEVSYRADGGPNAGGNPCNAVAAYTVKDFIWWKYNQQNFNALPGLNTTALYNILIAPSSNIGAEGTSTGGTKGQLQSFYCGSLSSIYGGGAVVQINSSTSSCATFTDSIANNRLFYTNPIYGVLLQRWNDSVLKSMSAPNNVPWKGDFGYPVQGPTAYNNGASTLTGNGAYYAWGMYFEKGFVWWIDYINNTNVPDEAQAYSYTGSNVFCKGASDKYEKLPTIYYGGTGPLGVSVIVEASLNPDRGASAPPAGTFYEVGNPAAPAPALTLDMHAHGYGGAARASDGHYKYYTWAFRDGTIGVTNGVAYDDSTKYVQHSYTLESVYTVRVQVVDSNNLVGYGDSLPIHVGNGAGGGAAAIWLIRMDGGTYNTNYNALKSALDSVGAAYAESNFSATTATDYAASATAKVAIFYRGGPGANGEPVNNTMWTQAQYDAIRTILNSGTKRKVLLISQSHATANPNNGYIYQFSDLPYPYYTGAYSGPQAVTADHTQLGINIEGLDCYNLNYNWPDCIDMYNSGWGDVFWRACSYVSTLPVMTFGTSASAAAERYAGAGSSGAIPTQVSVTVQRQYTTRGHYAPYWNYQYGIQPTNPGFQHGLGLQIATWPTTAGDSQLLSYGNSSAPGSAAGTGKLWVIGYSLADATITPASCTKGKMLQNVLSWLDSSLQFSAKTNGGFQEYSGNPEIVSVTPAYWDEVNHNYVTGGQTSPWNGTGASTGRYPDQSSTNMYRTTAGSPANAVLTTDANNDWVNGNDVDFQQTMYAYIDRGVNGTMELGGVAPTWNSTDDAVFYAGVLAADPDASWQRIANPATTPSIILKEQANNTSNRNPIPLVCGYYQTTGVGSKADDVYANYGSDTDAFTATASNWNNNNPLSCECLARWPATLKYFNWSGPGGQAPNAPDAYLVWQMYPGQGNTIPTGPNAGKFIGLNANWELSRTEFDVDTAGGWSVPGRDNTSAWNRPSFSFQDATTQGRAVSFNFRKLKTWNGDQNRDGILDKSDKFPVRVRLFTNHQAYYNKVVLAGNPGWPNHLADAGGNPATTPIASRNPSYLEGGTYVVDKGTPVYTLQVLDDTSAPDPGAPGTITGQGPGSYTVRLQFNVKYGVANYKIECDTYYNGVFGAGPNGNNGQPVPVVLVKDFPTAPNVEGLKDYTINIPANQANGNYQFAIRVTDQDTPATVATFVWPGVVPLFPQQLFQDDFDNLNNWTIGTPPTGGFDNSGQNWAALTSATSPAGTISGYGGSGGFAAPVPSSGTAYGDYHNKAITLTNAINVPAGTSFTISFYSAGYSETFWDGTIAEISKDNGTNWEGSTAGYWGTSYYPSYIYGFGYPGNYGYNRYGFSGTISSYGAGTAWVAHSYTCPAQPGAIQLKLRFWFCSDGSINYTPGICVDKLLIQ